MKYWVGFIFFGFFISMQGGEGKGGTLNLVQMPQVGAIETPPGWPWRGITIVSHTNREKVTQAAICTLAQKGVNLIRLRLSVRKLAKLKKISVEESTENTLQWADQVIAWCKANGIYVLISATDFPFDPKIKYDQTSSAFWNSEADLLQCLEDIKKMVKHFDSLETVIAYEFIAEPVIANEGPPKRPLTWNTFFLRIVKTVRETSGKYILFTPGPWGLPQGYASMGKKIDDPHIIYNFHFYVPHRYTHQGVGERNEQYEYPGRIGLKYWDKNRLAEQVKIVLQWATQNQVEYIFAGEFSVVRYAKGKAQYIEAVLSIFEENEISWCYFAFNSWNGWDYEAKSGREEATAAPPGQGKSKSGQVREILKKYWGKNLPEDKSRHSEGPRK